MVISHGAGIDSIKIQYDVKGTPIWSDRHGGNGGTKTDTVHIGSSLIIDEKHNFLCTMWFHFLFFR